MTFDQTLLMIVVLHLVAVAIPGPDFVCVSQASIWRGKLAGVKAALGISLGLLVHIIAGVFGLVALMASPIAFTITKVIGGAYLLYLGVTSLRSKAAFSSEMTQIEVDNSMSKGFWCNVLNPKVPLYFLSVFTVVIPVNTSQTEVLIIGALLMLLTFLWFSFVAIVFANPMVQQQFRRMGHWLDRVVGVLFVGFGLKVLLSSSPLGIYSR